MDESLTASINPMFCNENTFNYSMESQQNEKSTQVLWKGSLAGTATGGEGGVKI